MAQLLVSNISVAFVLRVCRLGWVVPKMYQHRQAWFGGNPDLDPQWNEKKKILKWQHIFVVVDVQIDFKTSGIKKKDSSGIISKNVEWNPALDGTTTARPQVPIAYFFPPFIFLQLNLNNADQVQSQRALEMDKGNSWWSTPLSSRAWQKKW